MEEELLGSWSLEILHHDNWETSLDLGWDVVLVFALRLIYPENLRDDIFLHSFNYSTFMRRVMIHASLTRLKALVTLYPLEFGLAWMCLRNRGLVGHQ